VKVFRFVAARKAEHSVKTMCRVLGVSRSGFHAWERRPPCDRELSDRQLGEQIGQIHERSRQTYGARRVHAELRHGGVRVGRKRVERLMRRAALSGLVKRRRGRTTVRVPGVRCAPDLVERDFRPPAPDRLWVADITYVRTWEGWLYLAAVVDCYSRRVVGWSVADNMRSDLVVDALEMAVARRKPQAGLVHHSDQGSQFVSLVFGQRCRDAGIEISMGSKGCCFDNAVAESFFKTLKGDLINRRSWPTKAEARTAIFEWIEVFYNRRRLHSTLGYLSPVRYEEQSTHSKTIIEEAA
jgi:putative transposase